MSRAELPPQPPESLPTNTIANLAQTKACLFLLPEYEWAFFRFAMTAVDTLMVVKNPVLSRMKTVPAPEIPISRNTTSEGEVIENKPIPMSLKIAIDFKDIAVGKLTAVTETINDAAEEGLQILLPKISEQMRRLSDAFGTAVDMKDAPFDHIAVRKLVEVSEIEFDENGAPDFESWIFTCDGLQRATTFQEMFKQFPPRTPDETQAWNELIQCKRRQFNDERRRRKLS
jgi:hypothetical protein